MIHLIQTHSSLLKICWSVLMAPLCVNKMQKKVHGDTGFNCCGILVPLSASEGRKKRARVALLIVIPAAFGLSMDFLLWS